jgi:hypothetical protein
MNCYCCERDGVRFQERRRANAHSLQGGATTKMTPFRRKNSYVISNSGYRPACLTGCLLQRRLRSRSRQVLKAGNHEPARTGPVRRIDREEVAGRDLPQCPWMNSFHVVFRAGLEVARRNV